MWAAENLNPNNSLLFFYSTVFQFMKHMIVKGNTISHVN